MEYEICVKCIVNIQTNIGSGEGSVVRTLDAFVEAPGAIPSVPPEVWLALPNSREPTPALACTGSRLTDMRLSSQTQRILN